MFINELKWTVSKVLLKKKKSVDTCIIICSLGWFSRKHLLTVAVYFVYKKRLEHFPIFSV